MEKNYFLQIRKGYFITVKCVMHEVDYSHKGSVYYYIPLGGFVHTYSASQSIYPQHDQFHSFD